MSDNTKQENAEIKLLKAQQKLYEEMEQANSHIFYSIRNGSGNLIDDFASAKQDMDKPAKEAMYHIPKENFERIFSFIRKLQDNFRGLDRFADENLSLYKDRKELL